MRITDSRTTFEIEPLKIPFGVKGKTLTELWQTVVMLESIEGYRATGLGTQSVVWSDINVFNKYSQAAGNALMYLLTEFGAQKVRNQDFESPVEMFEYLEPLVYNYGKNISGFDDLKRTFTLNSLVALDNAAWMIHSMEKGGADFDSLMPWYAKELLAERHENVAFTPVISYKTAIEEIVKFVRSGCFLLKIKLGADPDGDSDSRKMLEWDAKRLKEIHDAVGNFHSEYTGSGRIMYYLDPNGRYEDMGQLMHLLEYADKIGASRNIAVLEEPFPENYKANVSHIPLLMAADECIHSEEDALERIELGYRAFALKPVAKTLSFSLKICGIASKKNISCYCADLTANPILAEWGKNMAARLAPLPGIKTAILDTNGRQFYERWDEMEGRHPIPDASWIKMDKSFFKLDDSFYKNSGGIFKNSDYYSSLL